jgi:hypothetical protein
MSITVMQQALEFIDSVKVHPSQIAERDSLHDALDTAIEQAEKQEPVATVIEELEHDGQGFCAKVRWLYNPVPVDETLFWSQK